MPKRYRHTVSRSSHHLYSTHYSIYDTRSTVTLWQLGLAVTALHTSTKLPCVGPS